MIGIPLPPTNPAAHVESGIVGALVALLFVLLVGAILLVGVLVDRRTTRASVTAPKATDVLPRAARPGGPTILVKPRPRAAARS